ncbi:hypothetical protein [Wolbachia endosymbiont of Pentidionis agamae]|uniref:hypothetical protein n=1 Tax=Wolbachia endosymbiont of Pentidionis agamae TaxID=3110435 RepID=UPI002FCED92F
MTALTSFQEKISIYGPNRKAEDKVALQNFYDGLKKEHKLIFDGFVRSFDDEYWIKRRKDAGQETLTDEQKIFLGKISKEKPHFDYTQEIFEESSSIKEVDILSEINFYRFLLSVYSKIRELQEYDDKKAQQIVHDCLKDARATEAKDTVLRIPCNLIGVDYDPDNGAIGSIKDGLLEKVPFLGKKKKEKPKPAMSEGEIIMKIFPSVGNILSIFLCLAVASSFIPISPIFMLIGTVALSFVFPVCKGVKGLFSSNYDRSGTFYNPQQDTDNMYSAGVDISQIDNQNRKEILAERKREEYSDKNYHRILKLPQIEKKSDVNNSVEASEQIKIASDPKKENNEGKSSVIDEELSSAAVDSNEPSSNLQNVKVESGVFHSIQNAFKKLAPYIC